MKFLSQINVNTEYTLPMVDGTNGQVLSTDGQGVAYWGTISAGSLTLDGLSDVIITSPSSDQMLRYGLRQGDTVPVWHNFTPNFLTPSSSINALNDVVITTAAAGQILQYNGSNWVNATLSTVEYVSKVQHTVKAGVAITKGQAVYVTGSNGTNMIVGLASNTSEGTSSKTMGLAASTAAINDNIFVVTEGLLAGLDTSTATAGDPVWLGTNGNLIFGLVNKPVAPAHLVYLGVVTRVQSNNGEIFVHVQNGFELHEIHDVLISSPSTGQLLQRASDGLWKNWTPNFLTAHPGILAASSVNNSNGTVIQDITLEANGHVTGLASVDLDTRYYTESEIDSFFGGESEIAGYNQSNWDTAYGWGNHASAGYLTSLPSHNHDDRYYTETESDSRFYLATNPSGYITSSGNTGGYSGSLLADDNRTISPSEIGANQLKFGFTSWTNNNQPPYADYLHLRSYGDSSGGSDNLVMFKKSGIGMRIWQQNFGSANAYSSYADVWTTGDFSSTDISNWNEAYGWGDHAEAGYLTDFSYSETDTLSSVTGRGGSTGNPVVMYGKVTLGNNSSGTYSGNTTGLTLNSTAEVRSTSIQNPPALTWHYEGLATRHLLMTSAGAMNFVSPSNEASGVAVLQVNGNTVWHAGNLTNLNQLTNGPGYLTSLPAHTHAASDITSGTLSTDRLPKQELGISIAGNFGQWQVHSTYTNFNTEVAYWGWNYVQGNTNAPHQTSSQWYRGRFSLGSEYGFGGSGGDYWMEIAIPRYAQGNNAGNLFVRTAEDGVPTAWQGVRGAYATNAGYAVSSGNSSTTDQTVFSALFINDLAVATEEFVTSQGYITGYTETDTLSSVTGRGNSTATSLYLAGGSGEVPALHIRSGGSSWSEGLAIHPSTDSGYGLTFYRTRAAYTDQTNTWAIGNLGDGNALNHFGLLRKGLTGGVADRAGDAIFTINPTGAFKFGFNPYVGGNIIWHAGNDGSNSGLDSDLLDGYHETSFIRIAANSSSPTNASFAIGTASSRNFIQSHAGQPLDINPLGNAVNVGSDLTVSGTITENSSIRYKENVKSIPSVSQKVEQLDAVSYNKIGGNQEEIGLIAEDVAELFPEVVKYDNEGRPDGVNYSRLSVILLKAVQELTERVNKLENK